MSRTRVVLVGAGRRAQETILPALDLLRDRVELVSVHARRARSLTPPGDARTIEVRAGIEDLELDGVDAVVVAVPPGAVPSVARDLATRRSEGTVLMIDTPVLDPGGLGAVRWFNRFRAALAAEESVALPQYVLARRLIREGRIGRVRRIHLFHSGYRYHALASLKAITGERHPSSIRVQRWNRSWADVRIRFPGGALATIIEPRRYESGRFAIVGDRGAIADYPLGDKAIEIGYAMDGRRYRGLTVDGAPSPPSELDEAFVAGIADGDRSDTSLMGQLKIRAFMDVLSAVDDPTSPFRYPALDAISDQLSLRLADRAGGFGDLGAGNGSIFGGAIRIAARVMRPPRGR